MVYEGKVSILRKFIIMHYYSKGLTKQKMLLYFWVYYMYVCMYYLFKLTLTCKNINCACMYMVYSIQYIRYGISDLIWQNYCFECGIEQWRKRKKYICLETILFLTYLVPRHFQHTGRMNLLYQPPRFLPPTAAWFIAC